MIIIADENIPDVGQVFANIGKVTTLNGRMITNSCLKNADILLVRSITKVNKQLLNNTPVNFVATATSGINHIDVEYLEKNNILFADALGSNANSVAQYVISAICYWSLQQNKPLAGISLGIVGYGNVGKKVKILAELLNINCIINDPPLAEIDASGFSNIDETLACDIVTLHIPFTTEGKYATDKIISKQRIQQLKSGALFINSSRGEVVDEQCIINRKINQDDIFVVLDVWENEPHINLHSLKHTMLGTPHIAGYSLNAKLKGTEMIYSACCKLLNLTYKNPEQHTSMAKNKSIDFGLYNQYSKSDIRLDLLAAYDILLDDQRLKKLLKESANETSNYFDSLRKNYPIRYEWTIKP